MSENGNNQQKPPRKKGLTSLTLEWLAEKFRRTERIKDALSRGTYRVDSNEVAKAMLNSEQQQK
jgi:anti-sigma28 factor (negative regulator of flagellin synthesis)